MRRFYKQFLSGIWIITHIHQIFSGFLWGRVIPSRNVTLQIKTAKPEEAPWRPCPGPQGGADAGALRSLCRRMRAPLRAAGHAQPRLQAQTHLFTSGMRTAFLDRLLRTRTHLLFIRVHAYTDRKSRWTKQSLWQPPPDLQSQGSPLSRSPSVWSYGTCFGRAGMAFRILRSLNGSEVPFLSKNLTLVHRHTSCNCDLLYCVAFFFFLTNWRREPPPAKRLQLTLLWHFIAKV